MSPRLTPTVGPKGQRNAATLKSGAVAAARKPEPTVLLVDDDTSVRHSVCRVLASEGIQVCSARGVKDALDQIFIAAPDLVITDLGMAPLTGWDLIAFLTERYPALPLFVITAHPVHFAGEAKCAATAFFEKPLDLDALLTAIRCQLALRP